jgi:fumarate hydratase subunit beta
MNPKKITSPIDNETKSSLHSGDAVLLSGIIYTARDAAHKRLVELIEKGESLPFELAGATIYYAGPSPAPPGKITGAIGPTTSGRMDIYTPTMIKAGLIAMIGKGKRSAEVSTACQEYGALYFAAVGGAAALLAKTVVNAEVIAWPELEAEAIRRLEVRDMPLVVINDIYGNELYR